MNATWTTPDGQVIPVPLNSTTREHADTPVKVCIDTPGPTITIEATGTVDGIAAKALDLYREALKDWTPSRGMAAGTGFHTERSGE